MAEQYSMVIYAYCVLICCKSRGRHVVRLVLITRAKPWVMTGVEYWYLWTRSAKPRHSHRFYLESIYIYADLSNLICQFLYLSCSHLAQDANVTS